GADAERMPGLGRKQNPGNLFIVGNRTQVLTRHSRAAGQLEDLYRQNQDLVQMPRSYAKDRPRQLLRWISTVLKEKYPSGREIQAYFDVETQTVYISSNRIDVNTQIRENLLHAAGLRGLLNHHQGGGDPRTRQARHRRKLKNALSAQPAHA